MITRFYADNYKCLVNFEYKPQPLELIIGANGSGKSTVFEALDKVRQFVAGKADARELFPPQSGTKWVNSSTQIFEVDFSDGELDSRYRLEVKLTSSDLRIEKEELFIEGKLFMESIWRKMNHLKPNLSQEDYDDSSQSNDSHTGEMRGLVFPDDEHFFSLSNPNTSCFSDLGFSVEIHSGFSDLNYVKLNPPLMTSEIGKIAPRLNANGSNFASYYLYVLQQKQGAMFEVISHLRDVLPSFDSFAVDEDFEQGKRRLMVLFKNPDSAKSNGRGPLRIPFDDLSDGQRALIVLYTLLFCALDENATLVIDEPENYIGLAELQPLIFAMEQRMAEQGGQILMISHNPEFINMLTDQGRSIRFYRENNGHTRIAKFDPDPEFELTAAEIVARRLETNEQ